MWKNCKIKRARFYTEGIKSVCSSQMSQGSKIYKSKFEVNKNRKQHK